MIPGEQSARERCRERERKERKVSSIQEGRNTIRPMRRNGIHGVYTLLVKVSRKLADFYQSGLAEQKVTCGNHFLPLSFLSFFLFVCVCAWFPCVRDAKPGVDLNRRQGRAETQGRGTGWMC